MNQDPRRNLARTSLVVAIVSIISVMVFPVFLPYILAPIAITMAILSKGGQRSAPRPAGIAAILSVVALILNTIVIAYVFYTIVRALQDPSLQSQLDDYLYQHYGLTLQELLDHSGL